MAVALLGFGLVGCSSGSDDSSGSPAKEDPRSADQLASDRAAATDALLVLRDFPSGWAAEERDANDEEGPDLDEETAVCLGVDVPLLADNAVSVKSDTFTKDEAEVEADISIQATKAEADASVEILTNPKLRSCLQDSFRKSTEYAVKNPSDGEELPEGFELGEATVADLNFPDIGDDSRTFRLSVPVSAGGLELEVFLDLVFVRVGRATGILTFVDVLSPFDEELAKELAMKFAAGLPKD